MKTGIFFIFITYLILSATSPFASLFATRNPSSKPKIRELSLPDTLTIPSLKIQTKIEYVGKDKTGAMDVPKNYNNVGWYKLGTIPGAIGNAVIAGHYDSATGPAIFVNLSSLEKGDEIIIHNKDQTKNVFKVTDKQIYEEKNFPVEKIFGKTDKKRLNLITCAGTFNEVYKNYSHRTVIFTELKE